MPRSPRRLLDPQDHGSLESRWPPDGRQEGVKLGGAAGDVGDLLVSSSPRLSRTWGPRAPRSVASSTNVRVLPRRPLRRLHPSEREGRSEMDIVVERCAGLDVHKDTVVACVRSPGEGRRREQTIVTFGTTTEQLLALRDWLVANGVTLVGMESTGVYWKPVYFVLEERGRVLGAQRPAPAQRAGTQDRRRRRGVDLPAGRARTGAPELRAAAADPRAAQPVPLPPLASRGTDPRRAAARQGPPRRRHQAVVGRHPDPRACRGGRCSTRSWPAPATRGPRRAGQRHPAQEDPPAS